MREPRIVRAGLMMVVVSSLLVAACAGVGETLESSNPGQPQCRMGTDGVQACGYRCMMGTDGHMACANSPEGVCAMGNDGHATCSAVASGAGAPAAPPPTCKTAADGSQACGYNCQFGANGHVYCASRPDGRCAMNADGSYSCP